MRTIVVGAGKVGFEIARKLAEEGHDVVVIDSDDDALQEIRENLDVMTIHGNGACTSVLEEASIGQCGLFIAVTDIDEVNIIACMLAKQLKVSTTVARIRSPEYQGLKGWTLSNRQLGIDLVINPEEAVAYEIIKFLRAPAATEVEYFADGKVQMLGFKIQEGSPIADKTVADAGITSCTIGAIVRGEEVIVPRGSAQLRAGDEVFVIGRTSVPTDMGWLVGSVEQMAKNVTILGGGTTGFLLAQFLEKGHRYAPFVKLIERNEETCENLACNLQHTLVIRGDGTKPDLLRSENVQAADAFIAVTGQEQTNLLAGFMAKHAGVPRVIAEVHREDYVPVAAEMGIDVTVIPRMIVAGTILRLVRKANVLSLSLLKEGNLEVMEVALRRGSRLCGRPLRHLDLPDGAVIGSIIRGDAVIIPRGDTVPYAGDRVVIFAVPAAVPALEQSLREV